MPTKVPTEQLATLPCANTSNNIVRAPAAKSTALPAQNQSADVNQEAVPMKLCNLCSNINIDLLSKYDSEFMDNLDHQPGFVALEKSVLAGCEMCSMFLQNVIKQYCDENNNCFPEEARQVFRCVETHGKATCLIGPGWNEGKIDSLSYWIPHTFKEHFMDFMSGFGTTAIFALSNSPSKLGFLL